MYRSLALSVYLPSFLMSLCQSSVLLVIPLFALELDGSVGMAALVFSLRGLGNMCADVPAGYAVSRFGDRTAMFVGVALMCLAGFMTTQAASGWQLGVSAFIFGSSMATWLVARLTHISDTVPDHHRGKAISSMAGLQRVGSLLGPIISGFVAHSFGFSYVFLGVGVIAASTLFLLLIFVPHRSVQHSNDSPPLLKIVPHILRNHAHVFMTAGIAILLLTVIRAGRQLLIPIWGNHLGLDTSEIGLIVGAAAAVDMCMFPIAGYLMDYWGRKYAAVCCMAFLALGLWLMPFSDSFMWLALAAMVAGMGNGLGSGINMTFGSDLAPTGEKGEFLGVWRLMGDSGSFAGPLLIGQLATTLMLSTVYAVIAGVGLTGILMMVFLVRETLPRQERQGSG